jgi:WD40 repeat protein
VWSGLYRVSQEARKYTGTRLGNQQTKGYIEMVLPLLAIPAAAACCGAYANDCIHEVSLRLAEEETQEEVDEHVGFRERSASAEELQTNEDLIRLAQARRGGLNISDFNQEGPTTEFRKSVPSIDLIGSADASSGHSQSSDDKGGRRRRLPNNAFSRTIRFGGSSDGDSKDESDSTTSSYYAPRAVMADEVGNIEVAQRFVEAPRRQDSHDTASINPGNSKAKSLFDGGLSQVATSKSSSDGTSAIDSTESRCTFTCPSTPRNAASRLNLDGYIDGKFSEGRVFNVNAAEETWTLAYSPDGALLAVGLENGYGIAFYETKRYSLIRRISAEDTVVDVQWNEKFDTLTYSRQDFSGGARNELERTYIISAACKNGQVQINHIKYKVTKKEQSLANPIGQTTGFSIISLCLAKIQLSSGARCSLFLPNEAFQNTTPGDNSKKKTVEMAVGEKNGVISIISNIPASLHSSKEKNTKPVVRRIGSHRGAAKCLAVTRDGRLLASGGELGTVRIHPIHHLQNESSLFDGVSKIKKKKKDASTVEENQLAIEREGAVRALAFSRNGDMLIAGGYDKSVVVIHTKSWKTVRHMRHDGTVNSMAFDSTYRYLAVGSRDKCLTIYDTTTFHPIKKIQTSGWVSVSRPLSCYHDRMFRPAEFSPLAKKQT